MDELELGSNLNSNSTVAPSPADLQHHAHYQVYFRNAEKDGMTNLADFLFSGLLIYYIYHLPRLIHPVH
jgi:hypothetical protein